MDSSLRPFLDPLGVAVIGASISPEKLGYGVARNLVASGYAGAIHLVGQKRAELFGRQIFADLQDVPDPVDLAVLVVPAKATPETLMACAARGIHAAIIVSAGFRESGPEGARLEAQCLDIARAHGIRLLGPNCIGTIDTHRPLDTSFLQPPMPPSGGVAFVSHSGAFCAAVVDWSRHQGFGFSQIVSLGNQVDINETDAIPLVASDERTRVIVLYMEGVSDGIRFVRTVRELTRRKPVIALKVGRSQAGQRAVTSHTGALAASDIAFDAAFAKSGIFRATSTEQMFDWARALETSPLPSGRRIAVLTDAGGPGVIAADAAEAHGLQLAAISSGTRAALTSRLPAAASVNNPVDMLASASPTDYASCLQILLEDENVDSAMVILPPPPMFSAESVADALIPVIRGSSKPVVVALLGSSLTAVAFERFNAARVPTYPFPERAASALWILWRRATSLSAADASPAVRPFDIDSRRVLSANDLVAAYGISTARLRLATSRAHAEKLATEVGFPLVMKIAASEVIHKSDVGGVILNIQSASDAGIAYAKLVADVRASVPDAKIQGANLQPQILASQEVIIGSVRDPNFGALVMFGSGGIEAEGLKDTAFSLAPLSPSQADDLMERTWAGRRLDGYRNIPRADKDAVRDALIRFSWLAYENPEIVEIEINPLAVLDNGAIALDVRSRTSPGSNPAP